MKNRKLRRTSSQSVLAPPPVSVAVCSASCLTLKPAGAVGTGLISHREKKRAVYELIKFSCFSFALLVVSPVLVTESLNAEKGGGERFYLMRSVWCRDMKAISLNAPVFSVQHTTSCWPRLLQRQVYSLIFFCYIYIERERAIRSHAAKNYPIAS